MLDRFQELAAPYTQWVLANRNLVILLLAFALLIESLGLMIARWRLEKVSADLAEARQAPPPVTRPTYVMPRPAPPTELPPVRGGMTYARNLGGALDRAYGNPPSGPMTAPAPPSYRDQRSSVGWPEPPGSPYVPVPPPPPPVLAPPVPPPLPATPTVYPPVVMTTPGGHAPPAPSFAPGAIYYPPPAAPPPLAPSPASAAPPAAAQPPPAAPRIANAEAAEAPPTVQAVPAAERLKRWVPKLRGRHRPPATPPREEAQPAVADHAPAVAPSPAPVAAPPPAPVPPTPAAGVPAEAPPEGIEHESPAAVAEPAVPVAAETAPFEEVAQEPRAAVEEAPEEEQPVRPPESDRESDSAQRVLLIEDDESVARYYSMLFEARGYKVSIATDGVQGVDMATRIRPGLILLDVMMPRQNGMMVLQTLCATPATEDTPIVILSNFTEPTLIQRALQLGAIEYVVKTQVKAEALANAVPKWMQRERAFA